MVQLAYPFMTTGKTIASTRWTFVGKVMSLLFNMLSRFVIVLLNQSILKEISPEYSLEGLTLRLKLQYFGHLMQRTDLLEKTLMLGKIEGSRRRGQQRMRWLDGFINSMDVFEQAPGVGDGQGGLACCSPWGHKESDMTE